MVYDMTMLEAFYSAYKGKVEHVRGILKRPLTLAEKILYAHLYDAADVKDFFQGSMETQMTLMKMTDVVCDDLKARIGIDRAKGTYPGYHYMRLTLGEFIRHRYKGRDLAFGQSGFRHGRERLCN